MRSTAACSSSAAVRAVNAAWNEGEEGEDLLEEAVNLAADADEAGLEGSG